MQERDAAVVTSGAVAITVLFVLLLGNIFVYIPFKAAYFGPAHTTTATTEVACSGNGCELAIAPSVVGEQDELEAIEVYAVDDRTTIPSREADATIRRPENKSWNDATVTASIEQEGHYLLVARQSSESSDAQRFTGILDDTPNHVIIDKVEATGQA